MPDDIDDAIQFNLFQDLDNLSNWFRRNELIFNLKKGKSEVNGWICSKVVNSSCWLMVLRDSGNLVKTLKIRVKSVLKFFLRLFQKYYTDFASLVKYYKFYIISWILE